MQYNGFFDAVNGAPSYSSEDVASAIHALAGDGYRGLSVNVDNSQIEISEGALIANGRWLVLNGASLPYADGLLCAYPDIENKEFKLGVYNEAPASSLVLGQLEGGVYSKNEQAYEYGSAYPLAVNAAGLAQEAYNQAGSAFDYANLAYNEAVNAYDEANSAYLTANSAYDWADNAYAKANSLNNAYNISMLNPEWSGYVDSNTVGGYIDLALNEANAAFLYGNNRKNEVGAAVTAKGGTWASTYNWDDTVSSIDTIPSGGGGELTPEDKAEVIKSMSESYSPETGISYYPKVTKGYYARAKTGNYVGIYMDVSSSSRYPRLNKYRFYYSFILESMSSEELPVTVCIKAVYQDRNYSNVYVTKKTIVVEEKSKVYSGYIETDPTEPLADYQSWFGFMLDTEPHKADVGYFTIYSLTELVEDSVGSALKAPLRVSKGKSGPDIELLYSLIEEAEQSGDTEEYDRLVSIREEFKQMGLIQEE